MARQLRGITWDHVRGRAPLLAASAAWSAARSDATGIVWDARPLKAFEDQPLRELAEAYDLVMLDHPFAGVAASERLVLPVEDWASASYIADQRANSVGQSFASYHFDGQQWALATDAAAQVSAFRPDLAEALRVHPQPRSWTEVADLAGRLKNAEACVAQPLNPNHAYCCFVAIGVASAGPAFWPAGRVPAHDAAVEALAFLKALAADLHPTSRDCDPIAISDTMSGTDQIAYVPLMFGYSNYARQGFRPKRLKFADAPLGAAGVHGSILGGVGISVSAFTLMPQEAADFARFVSAPDVQAGLYVESEGQPGHLAAWRSPQANDLTDGFFRDTLATMNDAFIRPKVPGHRRFQELAGELVHGFLWTDQLTAPACLTEFDRLARELLGAE